MSATLPNVSDALDVVETSSVVHTESVSPVESGTRCRHCRCTKHRTPDCQFKSIRTQLNEFDMACKYSIAYQPTGLYVNWILEGLDEAELSLFARRFDISIPPCVNSRIRVALIRQTLYSQFYETKKTMLISYYRRYFETNPRGIYNLCNIDQNLIEIFAFEGDEFSPSCPREVALYAEFQQDMPHELDGGGELEPIRVICRFKQLLPGPDDSPCPICLESIDESVVANLTCNHSLCVPCVTRMFEIRPMTLSKCPLCRTDITSICIQDNPEARAMINTLTSTISSSTI